MESDPKESATPADDEPRHRPVLVAETIRFLDPGRGGCFVDCTVGLGGHTAALVERFGAIRVVGIDRDRQALDIAARRLAPFGDRVELLHGRFSNLEHTLHQRGIEHVSGILADIGVSSLQLGDPARGFSFALDGPLDMRMGGGELTAEEILNRRSEEELRKILSEYGEERSARRIARRIVAERPLASTAALRQLVERVKPRPPRRRRGRTIHPATQTFQALRIAVNRELDELGELVDQSTRMLESDGRLVVISYHSLEDRIVKHRLRDLARGEVEPITGQRRAETQVIEVLTRKPVRPGAEEVAQNPRARSARLRAARRL